MAIPALRCFLLLLFSPGESARGFVEEEGRRLPRWRAGNNRSSWGGVEPGIEAGLKPAAAAEPRERTGELCWLKALWTHEMHPQLGAALCMDKPS